MSIIGDIRLIITGPAIVEKLVLKTILTKPLLLQRRLRPGVRRKDDIRNLLRSIYSTEADLIPDYEEKSLTIRLHHLANRRSDKSVMRLCRELNASRTIFPGTELPMVYELVSN